MNPQDDFGKEDSIEVIQFFAFSEGFFHVGKKNWFSGHKEAFGVIKNLIDFDEIVDFELLQSAQVGCQIICWVSDYFESHWNGEIFVGSIVDPVVVFDLPGEFGIIVITNRYFLMQAFYSVHAYQ